MSEAIGRGVIEVSADTRKLQAGIDEAKRTIQGLGIAATEATKSSSASIDRYVKSLGVQAVTVGMTADKTELYKLALRGATTEQIAAAAAAMRLRDAHEQTQKNIEGLKTAMVAFAAVAVTGTIAAAVAFDELAKHAAEFQHMGEKTGDTAANMASLAVAAKA